MKAKHHSKSSCMEETHFRLLIKSKHNNSHVYQMYMCVENEYKSHRAATLLMLDFSGDRTCQAPVLMNIMKQF